MKKGDEIKLPEHRAMLMLPERSVAVMLHCTVWTDQGIVSVVRELSMEDIREAFRKADEGYIDEDDIFELTDKGRRLLKGEPE